jgi:hypothetical protein
MADRAVVMTDGRMEPVTAPGEPCPAPAMAARR